MSGDKASRHRQGKEDDESDSSDGDDGSVASASGTSGKTDRERYSASPKNNEDVSNAHEDEEQRRGDEGPPRDDGESFDGDDDNYGGGHGGSSDDDDDLDSRDETAAPPPPPPQEGTVKGSGKRPGKGKERARIVSDAASEGVSDAEASEGEEVDGRTDEARGRAHQGEGGEGRRSRRQRFPVLAYWKNERYVFERPEGGIGEVLPTVAGVTERSKTPIASHRSCPRLRWLVSVGRVVSVGLGP
jgi:hypothetical protein